MTRKRKGISIFQSPMFSLSGQAIKTGENILEVDVPSTWFNRLVYDAAQSQEKRKTGVMTVRSKLTIFRVDGSVRAQVLPLN